MKQSGAGEGAETYRQTQVASLAAYLQAGWLRHNLLTLALLPLSWLFRALLALRRLLYRQRTVQNLPVPVLVVGNIFIGGTGKTPFTLWLIQQLRDAGFQPGVIARGYGGKEEVRIVQGDDDPAIVGDEPRLLVTRSACPLVVGRKRLAAARHLLQHFPQVDILIADDGLQHYALPRQIEVMLFDQRGVGNGALLPAGPLREPLSRRRDFTIINLGADAPAPANLPPVGDSQPWLMRLAGSHAYQLCNPVRRCALAELDTLGARRVLAAAGIGNPQRFFTMLEKQGVTCTHLPLPDHYDFVENPFLVGSGKMADLILITEKDAVKCAHLPGLRADARLWVVPVEAQLDAALAQIIVEKCRGCSLA